MRIGELSRELEKAEYDKGHGTVIPSGGKYKAQALADAGISTSAAHRYEQLIGSDAEDENMRGPPGIRRNKKPR